MHFLTLKVSGFNNNNIWKLKSVSIYHLVTSTEELAIKNFLKYLYNKGLTRNS